MKAWNWKFILACVVSFFAVKAFFLWDREGFGLERSTPPRAGKASAEIDWSKGVITPPPNDPARAGPYSPNDRLATDAPPAKP